jgi:hypothetical protein
MFGERYSVPTAAPSAPQGNLPSMMMVACLLDTLALALLMACWPVVRGTTLVGPWMWLGLSLAVLPFGLAADNSWRLLLAALTVCPSMALLGAKRPQDKAWHFVVATFWLILALPGLQAMVMGKSGELDVHSVRSWLIAVTIVFGVLNSLFSRYWPCVLLAGLGQVLLLCPALPWKPCPGEAVWAWGLASYAAAVVLAVLLGRAPRRRDASLDRLWGEFREAYGLVWTLRVAERINHAARMNGWGITAGWSGIRGPHGRLPAEVLDGDQQRAFRQSVLNLLRRFARPQWIARRLGGEWD